MMNKEGCLRAIASRRTNEVVVTTMGVVAPWAKVSDHELDFASVDSGMGHAADFGLGLAMARPDLKVLVLNGDGSMLMSLGTLVTIVDSGARNLLLFVAENGTYEVTGNQAIPAAGRFSFAGMARAAGFQRVFEFRDLGSLEEALPGLLSGEGPAFVTLFVGQALEGPPKRAEGNPARYIRDTLAVSAHRFRDTLRGRPGQAGISPPGRPIRRRSAPSRSLPLRSSGPRSPGYGLC